MTSMLKIQLNMQYKFGERNKETREVASTVDAEIRLNCHEKYE